MMMMMMMMVSILIKVKEEEENLIDSHTTKHQSDDDVRQRDRVRQDLVFEIDAKERDQDGNQDQPAHEQRPDRRQPRHEDEQQPGDEFDNGVLRRDRRAARLALPRHTPACLADP